MPSSKKMYLLWDFAAGFYMSEALSPCPSPFHTVYVYTVYLFPGKRGGEGYNQREGWRRDSSQNWVENTNKTHCFTSLQILINTCHMFLYRSFFS